MPIVLRRDPQRRVLHARVTGVLTVDLALNFLRRARTNDQDWPLLFDATGATSGIADEDVDTAVEVVRRITAAGGPRAPVAIVASEDDLYRSLLLYEARCADAGVRVIRVFRLLVDAERWLEAASAARRVT